MKPSNSTVWGLGYREWDGVGCWVAVSKELPQSRAFWVEVAELGVECPVCTTVDY